MKFGLFQFIQLIAGLSTAGPILYYTMVAAQESQWLLFGVLVVVSLFAFALPGWLLQRYVGWIKALKPRTVNYIKSKLKRLSPRNLV